MHGSAFDVITRASSISLGELHARTVGDVDATALELASLHKAGLIRFSSNDSDFNPAGDVADGIKTALTSGTMANSIFVSPTATGLR